MPRPAASCGSRSPSTSCTSPRRASGSGAWPRSSSASAKAAPDERLAAVRRFSTVAGVALFVVAGSGTGRAYQEVGSWSALFSTGYGRIVLGKVAGIAILAGLGALNRWRNMRRVGDDPSALQRTARSELVVAVAILVLAGLLASLAPAKSSSAAPPSSVVAEGEGLHRRRVRPARDHAGPGRRQRVLRARSTPRAVRPCAV